MDRSILSYASSRSGAIARCSNRDYTAPCDRHDAAENFRRARITALLESRQTSVTIEAIELDTELELIELRAEPILARLAWETELSEAL